VTSPRPLPDPYGCSTCGEAKNWHGWQYHPDAGLHQWQTPTAEQIKARMLARRNARTGGQS
jgi:hypothetical protein